MAVSQNGWPVDPPRRARTVPGTDVRVTVADGPAGDVLMYVLAQFDRRVEDLDLDSTRGELDDWGYAKRPIRGGTATSNHASATAVDANATRHPLGVRGTFTAAQVAEIRRILAEVGNVVRWGGDYKGRADEMHFEINAGPAAVERAAKAIGQPVGIAATTMEKEEDEMTPEQEARILARIDEWLRPIYHQLTGSPEVGRYDGWPARPDLSDRPKTLVDYVRGTHAAVSDLTERR